MSVLRKILVVDDSDLVAGILTQFLEAAGYAVVRASNGADGVYMAYHEIPDAVIMDVEMPLMQGYQASRLLKKRRGVKDIPIIMHTSLSDDRDKYWAFNSGADAFINKDFDNLDRILLQIEALCGESVPDRALIETDAAEITRDTVFELLGNLFDQELFHATVVNMLAEAGRDMGSLSGTMGRILEVLTKVCEYHLAVILIRYRKQAVAYIRPAPDIFKSDVDDFFQVCLNDFYRNFPDLNLDDARKVFIGLGDRGDFEKIRMDQKRISSYSGADFRGKGDAVIGSLHLGSFTNNYFSEHIQEHVSIFARHAGSIIENAVLFNQVTEMEDNIRNVFSKFVPKEIIDDLVERQTEDSLLIGEKRSVAVLFSDIRSFTTISENNSAEAIVAFLNRFFDIMGGIIEKHGGTIDKFIGDAILAIFGAPKSYEDNALRAVHAALEMIGALNSVRIDGLVLPESGFNIGIGIHEGEAIVGNIGSADKFDYTVIGDTVNLASRLEGLTKYYGQRLIVSEAVRNRVDGRILLREADMVRVKGKDRPTTLFAIESVRIQHTEEFSDAYAKGLKLYKMGNWSTACEYFSRCRELDPGDRLSQIFIQRCREFTEHPPDEWDGAVALDFK